MPISAHTYGRHIALRPAIEGGSKGNKTFYGFLVSWLVFQMEEDEKEVGKASDLLLVSMYWLASSLCSIRFPTARFCLLCSLKLNFSFSLSGGTDLEAFFFCFCDLSARCFSCNVGFAPSDRALKAPRKLRFAVLIELCKQIGNQYLLCVGTKTTTTTTLGERENSFIAIMKF